MTPWPSFKACCPNCDDVTNVWGIGLLLKPLFIFLSGRSHRSSGPDALPAINPSFLFIQARDRHKVVLVCSLAPLMADIELFSAMLAQDGLVEHENQIIIPIC